jgi:GNAT superfamily N-acetyltransferase
MRLNERLAMSLHHTKPLLVVKVLDKACLLAVAVRTRDTFLHQTSSCFASIMRATIRPVDSGADFPALFSVSAAAFGTQTADAIWTGFNPGWDTPEGQAAGAERLRNRVLDSRDVKGGKSVVVLSASVANEGAAGDKIVGTAVWVQASMQQAWGDAPHPATGTTKERVEALGMHKLYPDNEAMQRFIMQVDSSLHTPRRELVESKANDEVPAVFVLDLCAVDPAYQGRGIASELVKWGLEEAKRRGGLECITEGSVMGRGVYRKLGFRDVKEIDYVVDEEFKGTKLPSNVFLRTGMSS